MEGRDISVYQGVQPPEWFAQWAFVIIRAFDDVGRPDAAFWPNWNNAAGRTQRGAYGWPVSGRDNYALGAALVDAAPGADFGYWADYESVNGHRPSIGDLELYVAGARDRSGGRAGFYSNLSELPRTPALDAVPWWFANPSGNPPPRPVAVEQYGIIDGVDANTAPRNPFAPSPPPAPEEEDDATMIPVIVSTQPGVTPARKVWQERIGTNLVLVKGPPIQWAELPELAGERFLRFLGVPGMVYAPEPGAVQVTQEWLDSVRDAPDVGVST